MLYLICTLRLQTRFVPEMCVSVYVLLCRGGVTHVFKDDHQTHTERGAWCFMLQLSGVAMWGGWMRAFCTLHTK